MDSRLYPQGKTPFYTKYESGVLTFRRRTDHAAFFQLDGTNKKVIVPSGATFEQEGTQSLGDNDALAFGAADDISMSWDGTNFVVLPVTDDTGSIRVGNGTYDMDVRITLGAAADYVQFDVGAKALQTAGLVRVDLAGVASSGTTDGSVIRMGTSGSPVTDDQAGAGFVVGYFDSGASSGWPAGLFISTDVTGAGGSFTALQGDAVVKAAKAVVTGIECFMQFSSPGKVTGAARACQATIDFGNYTITTGGGVYSGACFNIKGEGSSCDPSAAQRISCLELKTEGTFKTNCDFEKKAAAYAIYFNGFTAAAGVGSILTSTELNELSAVHAVGIRVGVGADGDAGSAYYIPLIPAADWN